jgi:hypothetical protein
MERVTMREVCQPRRAGAHVDPGVAAHPDPADF